MASKTYYRNVIQVEILSTQPWGDEAEDLETVSYQITDGECSGGVTRTVANEEVSAKRMARLLTAQGSDPEFLLGEDARTGRRRSLVRRGVQPR